MKTRLYETVRKLGARSYPVRNRSEQDLIRAGRMALPVLKPALNDADNSARLFHQNQVNGHHQACSGGSNAPCGMKMQAGSAGLHCGTAGRQLPLAQKKFAGQVTLSH